MRTRHIILTLTAAALVAAPAVMAQPGPGGGPHGPDDPGHGLLWMLPRLADHLELSQDQQDRIHTILEAQRPVIEALRDQATAAREAFRDSHGIGDFDAAAYRSFFEGQAQLHVEMQLLGAETVSRVWTVLTPEQQQEVRDLLELLADGHDGPPPGKRMRTR